MEEDNKTEKLKKWCGFYEIGDEVIEKQYRCDENTEQVNECDQRKCCVESRGCSQNVRIESFATFHLHEKRFAATENACYNKSLTFGTAIDRLTRFATTRFL